MARFCVPRPSACVAVCAACRVCCPFLSSSRELLTMTTPTADSADRPTMTPLTALTCPLDAQPLVRDGQSWCCADGHRFDIARQGHVNLLPVQRKRSLDPGDSKAMVSARQRLFALGGYQPLASALASRVLALAAAQTTQAPLAVLDAGCGEGFYLRQLACAAGEQNLSLTAAGLDISKHAVLAAAKQSRDAAWLVGTNAALPLEDACVDVVICAFGFPVWQEFARVLKPGGHVVLLEAGAEHLLALRKILYRELKPARGEAGLSAAESAGFAISGEVEHLHAGLSLTSNEQIRDLLTMTPHLYRAERDGLARAEAMTALEVELHAELRVFSLEGAQDKS